MHSVSYCPPCFSFFPSCFSFFPSCFSPLTIMFHSSYPSSFLFSFLFLLLIHSVLPSLTILFLPPYSPSYFLLIHPVSSLLIHPVIPSLSILFLPPYLFCFSLLIYSVSPSLSILLFFPYLFCFSLFIHPVSPSLSILLFPLVHIVHIVLFENSHVLGWYLKFKVRQLRMYEDVKFTKPFTFLPFSSIFLINISYIPY